MRPFYQTRPLACAAAMFGAGIYLGIYFPFLPFLYVSVLLICGSCVIFACGKKKKALLSVLGLMFFLGLSYSSLCAHPVLPPEGKYLVRGYVTGRPLEKEDHKIRMYLRNVTLTDSDKNVYRQRKMYLSFIAENEEMTDFALGFRDGEGLSFEGRVYKPSPRMNPYGFDFQKYLLSQNIFMSISGCRDLTQQEDELFSFSHLSFEAREYLSGKMDEIFGGTSYFPKILLLGIKEDFPDEMRESFSRLGIAHLLAVSGMHVGLLVIALGGILRCFNASPKERFMICGIFVFLYCALLNFSVPVVRASVLTLMMLGQVVVRRESDPLTSLAAAFMTVLILFPLSILSLSFQLSFSAVLGMILLEAPFEKLLKRVPWAGLRKLLIMHFGASLGVLIPTVLSFNRISLAGALVNPLASLAMNILLPGYMMITLIGCVFLPMGQILAKTVHCFFGWVPGAVSFAAGLSWTSVRVPDIPWPLACILIVFLISMTRYVIWPLRKRIAVCAAALVIGVGFHIAVREDRLCYLQLHAGQADCALILDGRTTIVIDTGKNGRELCDFLLSSGRNIDTLIVTHLHQDHCGGIPELIENGIGVNRVVLPQNAMYQQVEKELAGYIELLKEKNIPVCEVKAGDEILFPRGKLTFIWPVEARKNHNANDYSLCAYGRLDGVKFVTTGDAVGLYEKYMGIDADILKVAHHGSSKSSTMPFLEEVSPDLALVPCSVSRTLPSPKTLERLESAGAEVLRLNETGAVAVLIENGKYTVHPYLENTEKETECFTMNFLRP